LFVLKDRAFVLRVCCGEITQRCFLKKRLRKIRARHAAPGRPLSHPCNNRVILFRRSASALDALPFAPRTFRLFFSLFNLWPL
jgi:hypothetical protein